MAGGLKRWRPGALGLLLLCHACVLQPGQTYTCASDADCLALAGTRCLNVDGRRQCAPPPAPRQEVMLAPDNLPLERWVYRLSGNGVAFRSVIADANGNAYAAGSFRGLEGGGATQTAQGGTDILVAAVGPEGQPLWTLSGGGAGDDRAVGLTVDGTRVLYVLATYEGLSSLGTEQLAGSLGCTGTIIEGGLVLAALNADGTVGWAHSLPGAGADDEAGALLQGLPQGGVVAAFRFEGSLDLGLGPLQDCGATGMAVAWFDPTGVLRKARVVLDSNGSLWPRSVSLGTDGTVLVGGVVVGGSVVVGMDTLEPQGDGGAQEEDAFVATWDASGEVQMALRLGGPGRDRVVGVAQSPSGTSAFTGEFERGLSVDGLDLSNGGQPGVFTLLVDRAGALRWDAVVPGASRAGPAVALSFGAVLTAAGTPASLMMTCQDPDGTVRWAGERRGQAGVDIHALSVLAGDHVFTWAGKDANGGDGLVVRGGGPERPTGPPALATPLQRTAAVAPAYDAPVPSGDNWVWMSPHARPVTSRLNAVHGASANHLWVVGEDVLLRFTGARWLRTVPPREDRGTYNAVWSVDATTAVAAGDGGHLIRWDEGNSLP